MKCGHYILLLVLIAFCGCTQNGKNEPEEVINYAEDTYLCQYINDDYKLAVIYLAPVEYQIAHITLSNNPNPEKDLAGEYRVPTRREANYMHKCTIDDAGSERYLCKDEETGVWYTFCFGAGNVTKAGTKTSYTLRPIRIYTPPRDTIINL